MNATDLDAECLAFLVAVAAAGDATPEVAAAHPRAFVLPRGGAFTHALAALAAQVRANEGADDGIRIEHLARYKAEPGDVVCAYVPGALSPSQSIEVRAALRTAFPTNRVLVVDGGISLMVLKPEEVPAHVASGVEEPTNMESPPSSSDGASGIPPVAAGPSGGGSSFNGSGAL